jgi:aspartyl protease family protein
MVSILKAGAYICLGALALLAFPVFATNVTVVGLFPGKAVVVIDGASPRTISIGQKTAEGVTLVATDGKTATVDIEGKKHVLEIGEHFATSSPGSRKSITLAADSRGHFVTQGQVNGGSVRFLVDTGATSIALPGRDAQRLGIDYRSGKIGHTSTANGITQVYVIQLDTVTLGDITISQVDAVVIENGLDIALLGMSFLNRMEMKREGPNLTLVKRF